MLRRQIEWKLQEEKPYENIKKHIVTLLPLELFNTAKEKNPKQYASPLLI